MAPASNWAEGPRDIVAVLAKSPHPGRVKTRMCPPLDPHQAAELYGAMLADVLAATESFALQAGLDPVLCVHPPGAVGELARRAPPSFRVVAQRGGGLAERMAWALDEARATGAAKVLLRGSDNPALSPAILHSAVEALEEVDLVVSPDLDGGYGLIGMRGPWSAVFDHPMSRPRFWMKPWTTPPDLDFGFSSSTAASISTAEATSIDSWKPLKETNWTFANIQSNGFTTTKWTHKAGAPRPRCAIIGTACGLCGFFLNVAALKTPLLSNAPTLRSNSASVRWADHDTVCIAPHSLGFILAM